MDLRLAKETAMAHEEGDFDPGRQLGSQGLRPET